ncbi:hypothetical protein EVAR_58777_1 [Eumeta japonica]|uniref:Uncharacterized protein n=1 Tax=Eumeta variegata TaxID=151549 RepID=A0A4C1YH52_EUMVA|nr:hypothetical protein EVAR_58777_1 [Eumeta japonica]
MENQNKYMYIDVYFAPYRTFSLSALFPESIFAQFQRLRNDFAYTCCTSRAIELDKQCISRLRYSSDCITSFLRPARRRLLWMEVLVNEARPRPSWSPRGSLRAVRVLDLRVL